MKHILSNKWTKLVVIVLAMACCASCLKDDDKTIIFSVGEGQQGGGSDNSGPAIPGDDNVSPAPDLEFSNIIIPNIHFDVVDYNGKKIIRINITGIKDEENNEYLELEGSDNDDKEQNTWVTIDEDQKGFIVDRASSGTKTDVVFLVDNSGSMDEEADVIARDITTWVEELNKTLDVKFGCIGYDGKITGMITLVDYTKFSQVLNREGVSGVDRTKGLGCNSEEEEKKFYEAAAYYSINNAAVESPVAALRCADYALPFRKGANRVYINFTDEGNTVELANDLVKSYWNNDKSQFSVEFLNPEFSNWSTTSGTIHTIFSDADGTVEKGMEEPWKMSEYTGGSYIFTDKAFTNVSLNDLPVTGAMQNTYTIRIGNIEKYLDGKSHTLKITIKTPDGRLQGEREFSIKLK